MVPNQDDRTASGSGNMEDAETSTATRPQVGKLNHVAIAVPDLEAAASTYRGVFGVEVSERQDLPEHGVSVIFVYLANTKLELLHPLGESSPIARFLENHPSGDLHHICLETSDIKESIAVAGQSVRVLDKQPKVKAHGTPVAFLHSKDLAGVLVELEQHGLFLAAGP